MKGAVGGLEAFNRRDGLSRRLDCQDRARLNRLAIHQYSAATALRSVAADVGAGEAESFAQGFDEKCSRVDLERNFFSIDSKFARFPHDSLARSTAGAWRRAVP